MKMNKQRILEFFGRSESRAKKILGNPDQANTTLKNALAKAVSNRGNLEGIWEKVLLLVAITKDYINGNYTEIPKRSIIAILGGLLYFLSPFDVVPDFIPVLGFFDDIYVLNLVYKQVLKDLENYQKWKDARLKLSHDPGL